MRDIEAIYADLAEVEDTDTIDSRNDNIFLGGSGDCDICGTYVDALTVLRPSPEFSICPGCAMKAALVATDNTLAVEDRPE